LAVPSAGVTLSRIYSTRTIARALVASLLSPCGSTVEVDGLASEGLWTLIDLKAESFEALDLDPAFTT
jgi:hypothetical protein